jgi:DNA modification methylase
MTQQPSLLPDLPPTDDAAAGRDRQSERAAYRRRLAEALADPAFRATEGFPSGEDAAILALSDPPGYTACPNPFLPELITQWQAERASLRAELGLPDESGQIANGRWQTADGTSQIANRQSAIRLPFAADVSEGKNDPIYNAHSYHTKVPHRAIMRYILHYTDPGDIVFDGFCGTGMTGVASQLCGDRRTVESLGYHVDADGYVYETSSQSAISRLGARKAVLVDLSPAATFIAYNYNAPADVTAFERAAQRILEEVEAECGWMYETGHADGTTRGRINYTVWSDVFACPACGAEVVFWDAAVDKTTGAVRDSFPCPGCGATQGKRTLERAWETVIDRALGQTVRRAKQVPVLINYSVGSRRYEKTPSADDLELIQRTEDSEIPYWFPKAPMMLKGDQWGDTWRAGVHAGITHVHHFYTRRNLWVFAALWHRATSAPLRAALIGGLSVGLKMARFRVVLWVDKTSGPMKGLTAGTLYVPSLSGEQNWLNIFSERVAAIKRQLSATHQACQLGQVSISTGSSTALPLPANCIDYIFTDPPFGGNLMYSELNFINEAWLRVLTDNRPEAITNVVQRKGLLDYQRLMERCFAEYARVLKPGRWMTVEFHNSQNSVWNAIQEALLRAGFMIADVRTLDKQQGTFKQVNTTSAVKQDLIISAYKPNGGLEERFRLAAGTTEGAWDFVRQHLAHLPVVVERDGSLEVIAERQPYLLFDRMVAFHIQRGAAVPFSAAEFYAGLRQRFVPRDGMVFLPDQAPIYDRARLRAERVAQLALFVSDEKSAIQWLRGQLEPGTGGGPQTYQALQPAFLRALHQARHEAMPELTTILEQSFLQDDAGRWYAPDPDHASDLERLRSRALLREFAPYAAGRGRLRQFRTEAVRAGFADAWRRRDYAVIVAVAERLPEAALAEDAELLMYYDNATLRLGATG